jgi:hypothetical protein
MHNCPLKSERAYWNGEEFIFITIIFTVGGGGRGGGGRGGGG